MRRIDLRRWTVSLLVLAGLLLVSGPALAQTTSPFNALPNATPDTLMTLESVLVLTVGHRCEVYE